MRKAKKRKAISTITIILSILLTVSILLNNFSFSTLKEYYVIGQNSPRSISCETFCEGYINCRFINKEYSGQAIEAEGGFCVCHCS